MADEQQTVREVSWSEVFGFSHIFKSFKMAIHPGKIALALLAIALTWALGVFVMDPIWSGVSQSNRVQKNEAWKLWRDKNRSEFLRKKGAWVKEARPSRLLGEAAGDAEIKKRLERLLKEDFDGAYEAVRNVVRTAYDDALKKADQERKDRQKTIEEDENLSKQPRRRQEEKKADSRLLAARQNALNAYADADARLAEIRGGRIFTSFLDWQSYCISNAVTAVTRGRFTAGLSALFLQRGSSTPEGYRLRKMQNQPAFTQVASEDPENYGLLAWLAMMVWGLWWMFSIYPIYAAIYTVVALAIWAILGGAVCRIAALHAAREEKISTVSAVKFGFSKFLSFFGSPLLPLAFVIFLGFCLALAGLVGSIPYAGEWLFVVLFFLPLIAGAIIAFLSIGLLGGAPMMWPTIAVEGSDGFDGFSRSFSYVFARPFRYGLYWLVAAIYGTVCYLFVRLFAFISLWAIHSWSGWAMGLAGRDQYALGASKLDVMWARPTFTSFHGPWQWEAMNGSEAAASVILGLWVYLVSGIVLAFLACFLLSAATNIYFLMRRLVDATDLDDVSVEEPEEQLPAAEEKPAEEKPAEEKPTEEKPAEAEEKTAEETGEQTTTRKKPARRRPPREKGEKGQGEEEKPQ